MLKKKTLFLFLAVLLLSSVTILYALNMSNLAEVVDVVENGETSHGHLDLTFTETRLEEATSGFLGVIEVSADPGYYVKDLSVTFEGNDLDLGFEAGSEHGNFFRKYDFSPNEGLYNFIIPSDAATDKKVNVSVTYAKKGKITFSYQKYLGDKYDPEDIEDPSNYGSDNLLVENYMDGDIVLPDDCVSNGCLLKIEFPTLEVYNEYKAVKHGFDEPRWLSADARKDHDSYLESGDEACFEDDLVCLVLVKKGFKEVGFGSIQLGYSNISVYDSGNFGFSVTTEINNFNDILMETGSDNIGFNASKKEANVEIFYGTKTLTLYKREAKPIINDGENNSGTLKDFDSVTGEGYGYSTSYNNGVVTISINTYYQDKMTLELNLLKNGVNVLGGSVKINLSRFAFAGNAGQLLEVDALGRNCHEDHNGNTCEDGIYYSTQYRGILSHFYVEENTPEENFNSLQRVTSISDDSINIEEANGERGYARNKNFNPHAIALFYDKNDMIVDTKDFDLNAEIDASGFVSKDHFNTLFDGYNLNTPVTKDYVLFDHEHMTLLNKVDYFTNHLDESIMHDIVIISKDEATSKGIVKIALFLVNGEIEKDSIPSLTYGIGEGRIMEIRGGEA